jgi:hypothetical protein
VRRLMTTAACVAALFLAAGCEKAEPVATGPSAAPTSAAGSPSPSAAGNKEVCDQVKAINAQYVGTITAKFQQALDLALKNDEAGAEKAVAELNALTREWASKIEPLATKTNDPVLKQSLTDLLAGVKKLESENATINDMKKVVDDANTAFQKSCG